MYKPQKHYPQKEPQFIPDNISQIEHPVQTFPCQLTHANQQIIQPQTQGKHHRTGAIHIKYILFAFIPCLIGVCLYTYHQSVKKKQQKPFPHTTITNTACHYSQDIAFRFFMLLAQSFLHLIYFVVFKWIKMIVKRSNYPGQDLAWLLPICQLSVFGFFAAIGTIDGAGYPNIHSIGAVAFFIILFVMSVNVTILVYDIYRWDPRSISYNSKSIKILLMIGLSLIVVYCLVGLITDPKHNNEYVVILEWNLVIWGLIWLLTFTVDWASVFLTLKGDIQSTIKQLPQ